MIAPHTLFASLGLLVVVGGGSYVGYEAMHGDAAACDQTMATGANGMQESGMGSGMHGGGMHGSMMGRMPARMQQMHDRCHGDGEPADESPTQERTVAMRSSRFQPATLTVAVGDAVTWVDRDPYAHDVTSDEGYFRSPLIESGASWSFTFSERGTFDYHCSPHSYRDNAGNWQGMVGRIVVD